MINMEKELEYRPIEEVRSEGNFVKAILFKPKVAPFIIGALGLGLLFVICLSEFLVRSLS